MNRMTNDLMRDGYLRTDMIIEAFAKINRIEFVPEEMELQAEANISLPIGHGQTISQPTTVATMMELLDPRPGQKILDIGSGSGWITAMLAYIIGKEGKVIALEISKEIHDFGRRNVAKFGFIKSGVVEFYNLDGTSGYEARAPYDRILVSASVEEVPENLKKQLAIGGKMVIPVYNYIHYIERKSEDEFYEEEYPGFSFVPLINRSSL